jgi:hypothetical protein
LALTGPAHTGEDNQGTITIMIAHHRQPSGRTWHMDLRYFATQEWVQQGLMTFFKINGRANPSHVMGQCWESNRGPSEERTQAREKKIADPMIFNQSTGKSVSYSHSARVGMEKHAKSRSLRHLTSKE